MRHLPVLLPLVASAAMLAGCARSEPSPAPGATATPSPTATASPTASSTATASSSPSATPSPSPTPSPGPSPAPTSAAAAASHAGGCARQPFAATVDLAEASGAVFVAAAGDRPAHVVVVSDSGNGGAFVVLDATTGAELGRGALPLDAAASDDVEGLSRIGDAYVALTSNGRARHFRRTGLTRFERTVAAYPIADVGPTDDLVCRAADGFNCGRNWEGLCLLPAPPVDGGCAGFAASKRDGELVCLTWRRGRLRADPTRVIPITRGEALSGCAITDDVLHAGTNLFAGSEVFRVTGFADPARATVTGLGSLGSGFPEAIATGPGDAIYRFSDLSNRPSGMDRFACPPSSPPPSPP